MSPKRLSASVRRWRLRFIMGGVIFLALFVSGYLLINRDRQHGPLKPAGMYFTFPSATKNFYVDQEYSLQLHVDTKGNSINAVQTVVTMKPSEIEILGISTQSSFCSFYLENSFDTIRGEVHLACGTPTPGYNGDSTLIVMRIRPKITGDLSIGVDKDSTSVLANDGKATELLHDMPSITLSVKPTF